MIKYQVQFREISRNMATGESYSMGWRAFNAKRKYDLLDTIEEAKELMNEMKEFHKSTFKTDRNCNCKVTLEYRIAKIKYDVEYIEI